jgi:DNA replication protein DnaC
MRIPLYQMNREQLDTWVAEGCDRCDGSGTADDGELCDCQSNYHLMLERANFPPRLERATLPDLDWNAIQPEKVRGKLQEYVEQVTECLDSNLGLFLTGPVGCGKTHLAVGAARVACAQGFAPQFVSVPGWFQALRESYSDQRQGKEHELLKWMREAELLILDDLGAERPSDWMRERLYLIINERTVCMRPTWVTTNLTVKELNEWIGERSVSRLTGDAVVFTLEGQDYRQIEKQQRIQSLKAKFKTEMMGNTAQRRAPVPEEE